MKIGWILIGVMACGGEDPTTLQGAVFEDDNANGVWDDGEQPMTGARMFVDTNGDLTWQEDEPFAVTGADGTWQIPDVDPGKKYTVAQDMPFGWTNTVARVEGNLSTMNAQIVGGTDAVIDDYPWMADLVVGNDGEFHYCGASLIAGNYVLTAAHCLRGGLSVKTGRDHLEQAGTLTGVESYHPHPAYGAEGDRYDIAVLKLSKTLMVHRVGLMGPDKDATLNKAGTKATVLGWGATSEGGPSSSQLLKTDVSIVAQETCRQAYFGGVTDDMICAGEYGVGGKDSCQGDSGGPLVVPDGDRWVQVGVVSWGHGCGRPNRPGVYANVQTLRGFIDEYTLPEVSKTVEMFGGDSAEFGNFH